MGKMNPVITEEEYAKLLEARNTLRDIYERGFVDYECEPDMTLDAQLDDFLYLYSGVNEMSEVA